MFNSLVERCALRNHHFLAYYSLLWRILCHVFSHATIQVQDLAIWNSWYSDSDSPPFAHLLFLAPSLSLHFFSVLLAPPALFLGLPFCLLLGSFGSFFTLEPLSCLLSGVHTRASTIFQAMMNDIRFCPVDDSCCSSVYSQGIWLSETQWHVPLVLSHGERTSKNKVPFRAEKFKGKYQCVEKMVYMYVSCLCTLCLGKAFVLTCSLHALSPTQHGRFRFEQICWGDAVLQTGLCTARIGVGSPQHIAGHRHVRNSEILDYSS